MLYICIFSNKFDLKQTIRVLHITYGRKKLYNIGHWGKILKTSYDNLMMIINGGVPLLNTATLKGLLTV
jgi:hypothetical protein